MTDTPLDFSHRSRAEELMDQPDVSSVEIYTALRELNTINAYLGGHAVTRKGLDQLIPNPSGSYSVIDFGCGGGGNLRTVHNWAKSHQVNVTLTGIDLMTEAVEFSRDYLSDVPHVEIIQADFRDYPFEQNSFDIAMNSLLCHHFFGDDLKELLQIMRSSASLGVIINDLHRHPVAYYSIKWLTQMASRSRLVKFDAPASVAKGFTRDELKRTLLSGDITDFSISWQWAFRYLVTYR